MNGRLKLQLRCHDAKEHVSCREPGYKVVVPVGEGRSTQMDSYETDAPNAGLGTP